MSKLQAAPQTGATITYQGVQYRIWDVPCYGAIILESMDCKYYFRLQGQGWAAATPA